MQTETRTPPAQDIETVQISGHQVRLRRDVYSEPIINALVKGSYESGELHVVPRLFGAGDRVVEVGCALGCVSMQAATTVGPENFLGFEANPEMIDDAKFNFAMNGLPIRVENAVLKNQVCWAGPNSFVDFHIHKDFWASSLVPIPGTVKTASVPTLCLERELRAFGANALICDIEGGEIELLSLADLTGINKILMEIHYWAGREAINKLIRKLVFDGFSINFDTSFGSIVTLHRGLTPS